MIPQRNRLNTILKNCRLPEPRVNPLGALEGHAGLILLLSYYFLAFKKQQYLDNMMLLINESIRFINAAPATIDLSFGYGLTGFCHTLQIISSFNDPQMGAFTDELNDLDGLYLYHLENQKAFYHLDHFSGINGLVNYAVDRPNLLPIVKNYVDFFNEKCAIENLWLKNVDGKEYINLGVPHGASGTLFLINKLTKAGFDFNSQFLEALIDFFLSQSKTHCQSGFYFPARIEQGNSGPYIPSQLSWCYGDLPTGLALFEFGRLHNLLKLQDFSLEVLAGTLKITKAATDSTLCHGAISIANLYKSIFGKTNDVRYLTAQKTWFAKAIREVEENEVQNLFSGPSLFFGFTGYYLSVLTENYRLPDDWKKLLLYN